METPAKRQLRSSKRKHDDSDVEEPKQRRADAKQAAVLEKPPLRRSERLETRLAASPKVVAKIDLTDELGQWLEEIDEEDAPLDCLGFQPGPKTDQIDSSKCMARTWNNGFGGQCMRNPNNGSDFCKMHSANNQWKNHGRVDGPVPEVKLKEMLQATNGLRSSSSSLSPAAGGLTAEELAEITVGNIVRIAVKRCGRKGAMAGIGEVCRLYQDGAGNRQMLWRRFWSAEDLQQRCAPGSAADSLRPAELVETDEVLEMQLCAIRAPGAIETLSQEDFQAEEQAGDMFDSANGPFLCCHQMKRSGLLWEVPWDEESRESRRQAAIASTEDADLVPLLMPRAAPAAPQLRPGLDSPAAARFAHAAEALRPSAGRLFGRETEQKQVSDFIREAAREGGKREVLYISGMPGTGKTASVLEAVGELRTATTKKNKCPPFEFAHVNAMCLSYPGAVFAEICRKVPSVRAQLLGNKKRKSNEGDKAVLGPMSEGQAHAALAKFFGTGGQSTKREVVVLLIDEVDSLVTQAQTVLYRLFDWLAQPHARLAVLAIANTMDLPERLLPRVSSRLGVRRVTYQPYDRNQLKEILVDRLRQGQSEAIFANDALTLCAARVAASSGDARKALQVCRRAVETKAMLLAETGRDPGLVTASELAVAEADLLRANPAARAITLLAIKPRRLLLAIVLELRRRPDASRLPFRAAFRRYEAMMNIHESGGKSMASSLSTRQRHLDNVREMLRMLHNMSIVRTFSFGKAQPGAKDSETVRDGIGGNLVIELGTSLEADDVAVALAADSADTVAQQLLGLGGAVPPSPPQGPADDATDGQMEELELDEQNDAREQSDMEDVQMQRKQEDEDAD